MLWIVSIEEAYHGYIIGLIKIAYPNTPSLRIDRLLDLATYYIASKGSEAFVRSTQCCALL